MVYFSGRWAYNCGMASSRLDIQGYYAGRPLQWPDPNKMAAAIAEYFDLCDKEKPPRPYTVSGMAIHLDLTIEGLWYYQQRPPFFNIIKKAKDKIAEHHEIRLHGNNPTGSIFWLKTQQRDSFQEATSIDLTVTKNAADLTDDELLALAQQRQGKPTE